MSKIFSAKYYQKNKERLQKVPVKDIKIYLKKKNKNNNNMTSHKSTSTLPWVIG